MDKEAIKKAVIKALEYYQLDAYLDDTSQEETSEGFADKVLEFLQVDQKCS